jgi:phage-related protein
MKPGSLIFDGVDSESLNTIIQARPSIEAPLRKVDFKSTYGVDGNVPYDEGAYDNTSLELAMLIDGKDVVADRQKLYNVFDSQGIYKDLIPYFDPDKIYRVMLSDKINFENSRIYGTKQVFSAKFTVKPYKYLVVNDPVTIAGKYGTITNPTNYISQPIITINATGPVTLTVNGKDFNIKNVTDTMTLSSEREIAYQEYVTGVLTSMNSQIASRDYPLLKPGVNTISATGNVTLITIEPRWRSLV